MAKIKITEEAYVKYERITWQGEVEINGETIIYRYSEDNNGAYMYVYQKDFGWCEVSTEDNKNYAILDAAIIEWGNPREFGLAGEEIEIDDEIVNDYL